MHRHVELLEGLPAHQLDEVLGKDPGVARHVVDPLLRIQGGQLAAELRQRVDDPRGGLAHAGPERGAHPDRSGADHGDVADLVEVATHGVSVSVSAAPSSAPSARSTEHEMQVKVGVSRSV